MPVENNAEREARERLEESRALRQAIARYATRGDWLVSAEGPALLQRLERYLARVRRFEPTTPPVPSARDWLHAVQWNLQHGSQFEDILRAFRQEPLLAGADLVSLNETDLGMARSGNRDVAFLLAQELGLHAAWAALFLELEAGYRTPPDVAELPAGESLFGLALLSRYPLGAVRRLELQSPESLLFDRERHVGRFVALVAEVLHPEAPFRAVVTHLDVHGSPEHRAAQMRTILDTLPPGPVVLLGDFNTTTLRRGDFARAARTFGFLAATPASRLRARLLHPYLPPGAAAEPLFDALRAHDFSIEPFNDATPSLDLRFEDTHEIELLPSPLRPLALRSLRHVERRSALRLDWIVARGFVPAPERPPFALPDLMRAPRGASDHAPVGCGLRLGG